MYVVKMARSLDGFFISQTKPGPNIPFAVAMKVERNDSRDEKESSIYFASSDGMGGGFGFWR